ncbi:MAG: CinA family nicotinamide mononucleotide deamidase-related protein [Flavobacteriia bacterium]|nr:CinA family nicotinamide mononucleotide deamidase-related protein [Flavobacteriia bacterium]
MNVRIISIGDELLIGQTVNTNAAWLGKELALLGARILEVWTISDDPKSIERALELNGADLILMTGGLGPTKDDRTKKVLANYFEMPLVLHEPTLAHISAFFERRNRPMLQANIDQALVPNGCEILANRWGTAVGMWFNAQGKSVISLPGVPYEMKGIFNEEIRPRIQARYSLNALFHRTIITQGLGESFLAERIAHWEESLEEAQLTLAYLPSPGLVKLRIGSYRGRSDEALIHSKIKELEELIPSLIVGYEEDTLASMVGRYLLEMGATLGTVESCTAGNLASALVEIPGSSAYFRGGLLTYQTSLKSELLDIPASIIASNDVVSETVAQRMAEAGRQRLKTDYCLSTTGIMGPSPGDSKEVVGTVWVGLATPKGLKTQKFTFGDDRSRNIEMTTLASLNMLRLTLKSEVNGNSAH